ncbi:hypothetical protein RclHR1_25970002 [Rhizophagus clarus]|uniref:Uncharacterized protein n=1 Tax=Rhizophagus clarus TaxID=94130 RepID=A0A2Z6R4C3_9GLOM|nr:hypothetical protein RclHR1_25970002 [Rhizophagus clarus]
MEKRVVKNILNERIDNSVFINDTTQNKLRQCINLQNFIKTHCTSREYSFQIKKCGKLNCEFCSPARFSSDIFIGYQIPKRHNTTENDCPSKQSRKNKKEYAPQGMFISGQIRDFISCKSCKKPHCIFSKNALSEKEQEDLEISFEQYHYTCGSKL